MGFLNRLKNGWKLFTQSLVTFFNKPILLAPFIVSWMITAGIILGTRYYMPARLSFLTAFVLLFLIALTISVSSLVMLEFIQQIESGKRISVRKALKQLFTRNLLKALPIVLIWTVIWFIILLLQSSKEEKGDPEPSMEDAARTLGGADSGLFSWLDLGLDMLEKLVRMTVFLSLPGIAWEDKGPINSIKTAMNVIREHTLQFLSAYTLTGLFSLLMAIPLVVIFTMAQNTIFSAFFWSLVILYEMFIWSFGMYIEQMSVGILYLWHLKWKEAGSTGNLSDVPRPELTDQVHEFER
ncbi:MAG: hypothetical protein SVV03_05540 [Candidatus Nanohaloarchaea archaeon]|nr:hypothetical protein [Candidatus Nanohaloarchaea archaeon]